MTLENLCKIDSFNVPPIPQFSQGPFLCDLASQYWWCCITYISIGVESQVIYICKSKDNKFATLLTEVNPGYFHKNQSTVKVAS